MTSVPFSPNNENERCKNYTKENSTNQKSGVRSGTPWIFLLIQYDIPSMGNGWKFAIYLLVDWRFDNDQCFKVKFIEALEINILLLNDFSCLEHDFFIIIVLFV